MCYILLEQYLHASHGLITWCSNQWTLKGQRQGFLGVILIIRMCHLLPHYLSCDIRQFHSAKCLGSLEACHEQKSNAEQNITAHTLKSSRVNFICGHKRKTYSYSENTLILNFSYSTYFYILSQFIKFYR